MTSSATPQFLQMTGIHEPSGVQQLPDGRFLVVEDEKDHPFSLVTVGSDGQISATSPGPGLFDWFDSFWKLDDLEGITIDNAGNIYAITSHSRDGDGTEKKSRDKLVRFRVDGDRLVGSQVVGQLKSALTQAHRVLDMAVAVTDVKADGGFNIEALEFSADQQRLLVGFRSPLADNRAIIASIENAGAMFDADEPPRIAPTLITLDLGGDGIRSMAYISVLGGYLISSGPVARQQVQFKLWFWNGEPDSPTRRVSVPGMPGFEHAEGISAAIIDGRQCIVVVSDDGSRAEGRFAQFLVLDADQLKIDG